MTEEIYPMPIFPTLIVKDVEASSAFYQNVLGFKNIFTMPSPDGKPSLVHLRWVKYADVLITKPRDGKELIEPKGVGVILEARHLCMEMRGVKKPEALTTTSAVRGLFKSDSRTRAEFIELVKAGQ